MERKTLGGSKKMIFKPKTQDNSNLQIPITTEPIQKQKRKIIKKPIKTNNDITTFTANSKTKFIGSHINEDMTENFYEPNIEIENEIPENLINFNDDVIFLFSGIEDGKFFVDGEKCFFENETLNEMVVRNVDEMNVVYFGNESVYEIGSVFGCYTVCKKEI